MKTKQGKVAWFDNKLGFGFIKKRSGSLIYVHYRDIKTEGHRYLVTRDRVRFEEIRSAEGRRVRNVCSDASYRFAWRYAKHKVFRRFLWWLTKRKSIRHMWCLRDGVQYVSLIRYYLFTSKWIDIYLHQFINDDENIWHDHPWRFISFVLTGAYYDDYPLGLERKAFARGRIIYRGMTYKHRNILDETHKGKTFTLVITGRRNREWHYYDSKEHKITTDEYANQRGMEIKIFQEGRLRGKVFPKWEFADFVPSQSLREEKP